MTARISHAARAAMLMLLALVMAISTARTASAMGEGRLLTPLGHKPAPLDFTLKDVVSGKPVRLSSLRGKVVIVNFWSIACPVCRAELPTMKTFWEKLKGLDVAVLTVHVGGDAGKVRAFLQENGITLPVLHDENENVAKAWGVAHLPVTYILNPDGTLAFIAYGARNWKNPQLLQTIMALVPTLQGTE